MLAVAAAAAAASPAIAAIVVTAPVGYEDEAHACLEGLPVPATVVNGGATRQASVRAALAVLDGPEIVAVHDAARPFAPPDLFTEVVRAVAAGADGAIPVVAVADTVKRLDGLRVVDTVTRDDLGLAQTPQAFLVAALRAAHDEAIHAGYDVTDDAMLLEQVGSVVAIPGDPRTSRSRRCSTSPARKRGSADTMPDAVPRTGLGFDVTGSPNIGHCGSVACRSRARTD